MNVSTPEMGLLGRSAGSLTKMPEKTPCRVNRLGRSGHDGVGRGRWGIDPEQTERSEVYLAVHTGCGAGIRHCQAICLESQGLFDRVDGVAQAVASAKSELAGGAPAVDHADVANEI